MPEGTLCNKNTVDTMEYLAALLADKLGKKYYEEMKHLDIDKEKLKSSLKATCKSRLRTWLELCSHCGLCADSCFLYLANKRDPAQVPSYKIQSTMGRIVKRNGDVDNEFMRHCMDVAWSQCTCCSRCSTLPLRHRYGSHV